ncbi:protein of unknown function (plasmid) [Methylocella tundrae]|uniref:Uncharacterized protein n=1 Tax=Methylocella tundrae TaxID=227605 RepID=A0A4U8Z6J4_METTU|nr:protein of unknown function [Methylocella tundrae]
MRFPPFSPCLILHPGQIAAGSAIVVATALPGCLQTLRGRCGGSRKADRFCIFEVGFNRGHDDPSFDRDQLNTNQRDLDPSIDHDAFVEDPIDNFGEARRIGGLLYACHEASPCERCERFVH